jgi:hypothetical protein
MARAFCKHSAIRRVALIKFLIGYEVPFEPLMGSLTLMSCGAFWKFS